MATHSMEIVSEFVRMTELGAGQLQLVKVRKHTNWLIDSIRRMMQFPVALLPLLTTDLPDNQPAQGLEER